MLIVIETSLLKYANDRIDSLLKDYGEKIEKAYKSKKGLQLKNGDYIRFVSLNRNCVDGIRADVAIGPDADYMTRGSKQPKKIWDYDDFDNYLNNL